MTKNFYYDGPGNFSLESYYHSDEWKQKAKKIKSDAGSCARCGTKRKLQVHHLTYSNVPNENPNDLIVLCRWCHTLVHNANAKIVRLPNEFPDPPEVTIQRYLESLARPSKEDDDSYYLPPYIEEDYL